MKKQSLSTLLLLISCVILFHSCKEKEKEEENESEVITTVRLTFTKTDMGGTPLVGSVPIVATWKDADGIGAAVPTVNEITLRTNSYYQVEAVILNELANPAQDITPEIRNEGTKHQFFFPKTGNGLNPITYNDLDTAGKPIGLKFKVATTATVGDNTLKVILRHELNKSGANVDLGDITNAGGDTDIETTPAFSIKVALPAQ